MSKLVFAIALVLAAFVAPVSVAFAQDSDCPDGQVYNPDTEQCEVPKDQ